MRIAPVCGALLAVMQLVACAESSAPQPTPPLEQAAFFVHLNFLADDSLYGRGAGTPSEWRAAEYVRDAFAAAGLDPGVPGFLQTFPIGDRGQSPNAGAQSQNVVGILPGSGGLADEWVVVGAHYDHVGWRQIAPDSIEVFNGADDNGSGTALLIELARYATHFFMRGEGAATSRRSIMFQAYGAEEIGLVGSDYFCATATVPLDDVAAMVNLDMVGRLRDDKLTLTGASLSTFLPNLLAAANTDGLDLVYDDRYLGASDHRCFYDAGRPVVHFFTGLHPEYHSTRDDADLINGDGMLLVGNLVLRTLVALAAEPLD
jgi:hypothetical protein